MQNWTEKKWDWKAKRDTARDHCTAKWVENIWAACNRLSSKMPLQSDMKNGQYLYFVVISVLLHRTAALSTLCIYLTWRSTMNWDMTCWILAMRLLDWRTYRQFTFFLTFGFLFFLHHSCVYKQIHQNCIHIRIHLLLYKHCAHWVLSTCSFIRL